MKKIIAILFLSLLVGSDIAAQSMRSVFIQMPDTLMPLLTRTNREDCIDFIDAGMKARVTNRMEGKSELITISDDYIFLKTSDYASMQIKMLPCEKDTVICIINSVCAEVCDSRISFYTKEWKRIGNEIYFNEPAIDDFFIKGEAVDTIAKMCDIRLVKLSMDPVNNTITAEYTMPTYMSKEDSARVAPHLRPIIFEWNGERYNARQ